MRLVGCLRRHMQPALLGITHRLCALLAGALASKIVLVPSSVQSYDKQLAAQLWDLSADTARIARQLITK